MSTSEVGTLEQLWAQKLKQLHGLAVSISTERNRGNEAGVQAMLPVFRQVASDMNVLSERIRVDESALDWVEQFLMNVERGAEWTVQLPKNILDTSGLKPLLYIGLALGAMYLLSNLLTASTALRRELR